jgi:hypothetical protein
MSRIDKHDIIFIREEMIKKKLAQLGTSLSDAEVSEDEVLHTTIYLRCLQEISQEFIVALEKTGEK